LKGQKAAAAFLHILSACICTPVGVKTSRPQSKTGPSGDNCVRNAEIRIGNTQREHTGARLRIAVCSDMGGNCSVTVDQITDSFRKNVWFNFWHLLKFLFRKIRCFCFAFLAAPELSSRDYRKIFNLPGIFPKVF
jgi:hypothetical protein